MQRDNHGEPSLFLTPRERQIVGGVVRGLSNHEIADELHLSEQTIKNVLSHIYARAGVRTRVQLAAYALRNRVVGDA